MSLDAPVREFLAAKPDSGAPDAPIAHRRNAIRAASDWLFERFGERAEAVPTVEEYEVPGEGGEVRVRVYRPHEGDHLPLHVFLHGGGFWLGSVDEAVVDATCRERALGADCLVVSVDYRLAPEHPYPVPLQDCYDALLWAHDHAGMLGGDPANMSVGGVSAGANLAAAVALAARDRQAPPLRLQLLEVPPLDLTLATMRACDVGDDFGITVAEMELSRDLYLGPGADALDPLVSPLRVADVAGLPATRIMTAEFDPLKDDGRRYAQRLRAAGVPVSHTEYPGAVHGAIALTGTWEPARTWRSDVIRSLRRSHHPSDDSTTAPEHRAGTPTPSSRVS